MKTINEEDVNQKTNVFKAITETIVALMNQLLTMTQNVNRFNLKNALTFTALKIGVWNANGLSNHSEELKIFIKIHHMDVLLISETHFTSKSYFRIPGYNMHHTNHPDNKARGGSAMLIRSDIKHHVL
ncbi:unnamed protein product [Danaus chrysippus]|uniref:(African queen) hypothetical protein n=1 Tax=Danaus chrysippus TaxID=151541 RepID=A0A8J2WAJ9_9NEOP|nr:unnamed protein product [Danaus chrysippus]